MVSISKKYKFVYIAIPKTASTSITKCLEKFTDEPDFFHHARAIEVKKYLEEKELDWNDFYCFSTVRNPWTLLVSAYNHMRQQAQESYTNLEQYPLDFPAWVKKWGDVQQYHIEYMCYDMQGKCLINSFLKMEELDIEFPKLMKRLGLNAELPMLNIKPHESYREYYDEEAIGIVAKTYKKEIGMFDYRF